MKNVLIVEDDVFIRDISSIKLKDHGYLVSAVGTGKEALEALEADTPQVVLLDLDLPDISGLEVLKHMKKSLVLKNIPVVVFSNNDDVEMKKQVSAEGVAGFFVKASTDYNELFLLIDTL